MAEAEATGTRKEIIAHLCKVDLLVLEDLGMKRLPPTAGEDLLEIFVRRYEKGAIILTTNWPMEDWGTGAG
jgi:DNA replication protein DnaC